jgi:hypothetical protein
MPVFRRFITHRTQTQTKQTSIPNETKQQAPYKHVHSHNIQKHSVNILDAEVSVSKK